ncbi:hypothetical protein P7K49_019339 [Saguinus oedipus]|uniref:Uncharacterized protein n=1 Tax=Saguinus oedipus TaxID=9490 RepID=A0ABQ9UX22_SAGOE|nr:hypothetical protein P7K49_019335 [Saguinus oedipus]KAK2101673.1 hypothetical protein P7K49_019339 [Saguinus oedipus]
MHSAEARTRVLRLRGSQESAETRDHRREARKPMESDLTQRRERDRSYLFRTPARPGDSQRPGREPS